MNKKSLITMLVALCLVGAVGVGATLAYFTDKTDVSNKVTMGHVDIELFETENGDPTSEGLEFKNIVPGDTLEKDPTVRVADDSEDCFVRVKVEFTGFALTDADKAALLDDIDTAVWTYVDGYYYHNAKMTAKEEAQLFDEVVIPTTWGNKYADAAFEINVYAEAIQAKNTGETAVDAFANLGEAGAEEYVKVSTAAVEPIG
jgi:predicted ribosomally synthesized peptide with SipW-like signal peptide